MFFQVILAIFIKNRQFLSSEDLIERPLHLFITLGKEMTAFGVFYDDDNETFEYQNVKRIILMG